MKDINNNEINKYDVVNDDDSDNDDNNNDERVLFIILKWAEKTNKYKKKSQYESKVYIKLL